MADKRYIVIAECVDVRTGKRFQPEDEFLPAPDAKQAMRLVGAGCIEEIAGNAPPIPTDELDATSDAGLADIAKKEKVDITGAADRVAIVALIRAAREASTFDVSKLDHDGLVAKAKEMSIDIAATASDDDIRKVIIAKLAA